MTTPIPKSFCAAPWTSVHAIPDGTAVPCCIWDFRLPVGDLTKNTINEIAHGEKLNDLRRRMLAGENIPECLECNHRQQKDGDTKVVEWTNLKNGYNKLFRSRIPDMIKNTNPDGSLKKPFEWRLLHLRFSNLCNYGCRSCNPWLSSIIAQEKKLPYPSKIENSCPSMLEQILEHIDVIDYINMAGGEPLLIDEHWIIMDELIKRGRTNVAIDMFTNLSKLVHKTHDLIAYAKQFPNFTIYASLDAIEERAEVYRWGTVWENVQTNLKKIVAAGINLKYSVTIGATNIMHIPDLHQWLLNNKLLNIKKPSQFRLHSLVRPMHISTKIMPKWYKDKVAKRILDYITLLKTNGIYHGGWDFLIDFMYSEDYTHFIPKFVEHHKNLDKLRGTDIFKTFPEIVEWCN